MLPLLITLYITADISSVVLVDVVTEVAYNVYIGIGGVVRGELGIH